MTTPTQTVVPSKSKKSKKKGTKTSESGQQSSGSGENKKQRRRKKIPRLNIYISKVLKQVHPDKNISRKSMMIISNLLMDVQERLALEAAKVAAYSKKKTIGKREIETATKLVLRGELIKHALSEGQKAVTKFTATAK